MFGIPLSEIVWFVALIGIGGALVGVLAGLFGIGGGAIIIPVLYEVFGLLNVPESLRMQLCVGTSLAIIIPTTIRSYYAHKARGTGLPEVVRIWTLPAICGVIIGATIAAHAPAPMFKIAFMVFAAAISVRMFIGGDGATLGSQLPNRAIMAGFGFLTGLISSLVGVSGGSVSNAVLTLYGKSMQQAVATSAGIGVPITIVGTIGYAVAGWSRMAELPPLSLGFVSLIGFALIAPVSIYTASYGVRLAHWLPRRRLELAFAAFLAVVSLRFFVSLL
jgi:uncharacterized membrane protein YfcA